MSILTASKLLKALDSAWPRHSSIQFASTLGLTGTSMQDRRLRPARVLRLISAGLESDGSSFARFPSRTLGYALFEAWQLFTWQRARRRRFAYLAEIKGHRFSIDPSARVSAYGGCNISIGAGSRICHEAWLCTDNTYGPVKIRLGKNTYIGRFSTVYCGGGDINIGDDTMIAGHVTMISGNHRTTDPNMPMRLQGYDPNKAGIHVGRDVWIGSNVVVLAGVNIGDGAVIGAGSVVTKDIPPRTICVGSPALPIRTRAERTQYTGSIHGASPSLEAQNAVVMAASGGTRLS